MKRFTLRAVFADSYFYGAPEATRSAGCQKAYLLGPIGAGTGLAATGMFSHGLLGEVNRWFIAPMDALAELPFGVPGSPLTQPWSIVGGNLLSVLIGVSVGVLAPHLALACGLAAQPAVFLPFGESRGVVQRLLFFAAWAGGCFLPGVCSLSAPTRRACRGR